MVVSYRSVRGGCCLCRLQIGKHGVDGDSDKASCTENKDNVRDSGLIHLINNAWLYAEPVVVLPFMQLRVLDVDEKSELFSVNDSIDTRTAGGRLVLNVLFSVAQWEREAIGERTRDALRHKIDNRERVGKVRFGFDLADDGRTLVDNQAEQDAIAWMKTLRADGFTLRQIAAALTDRGVATKEGRNEWTHTAVSGILKRAA